MTKGNMKEILSAVEQAVDAQVAHNKNVDASLAVLAGRVTALEKGAATQVPKPDVRKFISVPVDQWDAARVAKRLETLGTNAKVLKEGVAMLQQFVNDGRLAPVGNAEMLPGVTSSVVLNKLTTMAAEADNALLTCLAMREGLQDAGLI